MHQNGVGFTWQGEVNLTPLLAGRVGINIRGNKYRVVLAIDFPRQLAKVRFVGTHEQYDLIDAETI
jgi:mRNA interferase HigB